MREHIMMQKFLVFFILLSSVSAMALEIDEKLTMRIVKTSQTKKTILINRGIEDGLTKGDHAKFFLSVGVVARGVVVKLSPTRSVWSIYRLVNPEYIKDGQVMNLKITPPVKITQDDSRSLLGDDSAPSTGVTDPRELGIPLAEGADDLNQGAGAMDSDMQGEKSPVNTTAIMEASSLRTRVKEVFGTLHFAGFNAKAAPNDASGDYPGQTNTIVMGLGGEFYSRDEKKWFSRFSLVGQYSLTRTAITGHEGTRLTENTSEYGGGFHWYPFTRPSRTYRLIPYARGMVMMGTVNTKYEPGLAGGTGAKAESLSGSSMAFAVGGGTKYYLHNGLGARLDIEYYTRGDKFSSDSNGVNWITTKNGPRFTVGLSYRW
jgi:hypothetical protein